MSGTVTAGGMRAMGGGSASDTRRTSARLLFLLIALARVTLPLPAQEFRGEVVEQLAIEATGSYEVELGSSEVALLAVAPQADRFVRALQLTVLRDRSRMPDGSFTLALYGSVTEPEGPGVTTLAGRRLEAVPLVGMRQVVIVPLDEGESAATGALTTPPADPRTGFVGVQLVPLMKGMSEAVLGSSVVVEVIPLLRRIGAIEFELVGEAVEQAAERLEVTVGGAAVDAGSIVERAPGIYRVTATAGDYLAFAGNVGVELGRTTNVTLETRIPRATVRLVVPSVADLFMNGEAIDADEPLELPPGTHTLLVRLGDFTISRDFRFEANRSYEIEMDLDLLLNQN